MRHVSGGSAVDSDPIAQVAARARALAAAGDLPAAADLLGPALSDQEPDPAAAGPPVADAAAMYARILTVLNEPEAAQGWAEYALAASRRLHGPTDERTLGSAATLAAVLHRTGALHRAADLYEELIGRLAEVDGDESARALAARADLATVLHARGDCRAGRRLLAETWDAHRTRYGEADPAGIKMLARLGGMERACGDAGDGDRHLGDALRLSRAYLGAGHPLTAQVAALVEAPPDTGHLCASPELPAAAPPGPQAPAAPEAAGAAGANGTVRPEAAPVYEPAGEEEQPEGFTGTPAFTDMPPYRPKESYAPTPPEPPPAEGVDEAGPEWGPPPPPPDSDWRPRHARPEPEEPEDDLDEPYWPEDAYPPSEPAPPPPPTPARETDPMVFTGEIPRVVSEEPPPPGFGRLPSGSANPVLLGLVAVIAGTLAAAGVGFVLTTRGNDDKGTAARPSATAPPATAPPAAPTTTPAPKPAPATAGPPTGVKLTDEHGAVTVTWKYPAGAEGPVVISGGRTGQPMQAFATLPAGSTRYTVYGLASSLNYCFRVAVAHSTDVVARANPVCTHRR